MKNMNVKIKGSDYKIKFVDYIDHSECIVGRCNSTDKLIYIKNSETERFSDFIDTLSHELWHAIFNECGLRSRSDDESLVEALGFHTEHILKLIYKVISKQKGLKYLKDNLL